MGRGTALGLLARGLLVLFALIGVGFFLFGEQFGVLVSADGTGYWTNLFTELIGIGVTIAVVDWFARQRETERRKKDLVRRAGSRSNDFAKDAVEEMGAEGWLFGKDSLLRGARLHDADLSETDLRWANMEEANLYSACLNKTLLEGACLDRADLYGACLKEAQLDETGLKEARLLCAYLKGASLSGADLRETNLAGANLEEAYLVGAYMEKADLRRSSLQKAILQDTSMKGTNLWSTDLRGCDLYGANLLDAKIGVYKSRSDEYLITANAETVLPDGTAYDPDLGLAQFERFTNPNHPDFWEPEWVKQEREAGSDESGV